MERPQDFPVKDLIAWYRRHARDLPWRSMRPGAPPDPYRTWLSEVMLQQTTVAAVAPRFERFLRRWPTVTGLAAAPLDEVLSEWAGLGYYARARNLHKAAVVVARDCGGVFPDTEERLRALPGVGAYTAAAIAAIAFDRRAVVVDGNVERVMARWFAIETPFPAGKEAARVSAAAVWPDLGSGDFAQALMDLGAGICGPRAPSCEACPISKGCAAMAAGAPERYPRRAPKSERPTRRGAAFALFDGEGRVLAERRPERGLLGGMTGLPGTEWASAELSDPLRAAPAPARWSRAGAVTHAFTHFRLELEVFTADAAPATALPNNAFWTDAPTVRMPTVMRKALDAALEARGQATRRKMTEPAE
jgi:A/G-specific adenine glycosylase